jgi:AcrR family transcriptional regulator
MQAATPAKQSAAIPRWRRRKEARHSEILAAALGTFVERGFAATKLEEVARRAGVTKGTMYLYFESKSALFKAVVRESLVPVLALGEQTIDEHRGSSGELIRKLLVRWWETVGETDMSGLLKLAVAEASNFPDIAEFYYSEVVQRGNQLMARAIRRGIESGEFRAVDASLAVRACIAPALQAALWKHSWARCSPEPLDARAFIELHVDLFLRGIANPEFEGESRIV